MEKLQSTEKPCDGNEEGVSSCRKLKVEALDRRLWRTGFARGCRPAVRQTDIRLTTILILAVFYVNVLQ